MFSSSDFDRRIGRVIEFPVIDLFMDYMYNKSASASDTFSFVLSFVVRFPESEESTEFLGTMSAVLMQYVFASKISMDGNMMESFWRTVGDNIFGGFVEVWSYGDDRNNAKMNILACRTGKLLFETGEKAACWICGAVPDKVVFVEKWESVMKYNAFDCDGNRLLEKWTDFCISATEDGGLLRVGPSSLVDYSGKPISLI